jgi:hypothetical protein
MTHIVALSGRANCGKSQTMRAMLRELRRAYGNPPQVVFREDRVDFKVILEIDGQFIAIESQGDPNSRLPESLEQFSILKCHTIICATRRTGQPIADIRALAAQPGYTLTEVQQTDMRRANPNASNLRVARILISIAGL